MPNLSWSTLPFRRFDHGLGLSDLSIARFDRANARFDRADARFDRADGRFDRKNSRTDPMIAQLDLEIVRLDGENAAAYGVIRQDDWPDAPPYPGMRPFDARKTRWGCQTVGIPEGIPDTQPFL